MKKMTVIILSFFISYSGFSQIIEKFSIDSGGASTTAGDINILYTVGEVNVQEINLDNIHVSEGFIEGGMGGTLSIDNMEMLSEIEIFPNPASHYFNIKSKVPINKIEMYDLLGRQVLNSVKTHQVKVEHLPQRTYLLKVFANEKSLTKKVIVK